MALASADHQKTLINTNHLLWAIFSSDNVAQDYMKEQHVDPNRLLPHIGQRVNEPAEVLETVWKTAVSASPERSGIVTSLDLLSGLLRFHDHSSALKTLRLAGYDTTRLRNTLIGQISLRQRTHSAEQVPWRQDVEEVSAQPGRAAQSQQGHGHPQTTHAPPPEPPRSAPSHGGAPGERQPLWTPGLSPDHPLNAPNPYLPQPAPQPIQPAQFMPQPMPQHISQPMPQPMPQRPPQPRSPIPGSPPPPVRPSPRAPQAARPAAPPPSPAPPAGKGGTDKGPAMGQLLKGRFGSRKPARDRSALPRPSMKDLADGIFGEGVPLDAMRKQVDEDLRRLGPDLGAAQGKRRKHPAKADREDTRAPGASAPEPPDAPPTVRGGMVEARSPEAQRQFEERYALDPDRYPTLSQLGRNLSLLAAQGRIDPLVGRDVQIAQLTDILNKRRSNNPLLVGPAGVGKTAIVEGLALDLIGSAVPGLSERVIIELEMGRLLSGTQLRGSFSERLIGIKDEVALADGQIVVFLDEIHTWIGAGASGDGGADAAGEIKAALARGRFPCIGATTTEEYAKFIETDPAFRRRFQTVEVDEPSVEACMAILEGVIPAYEKHHRVAYEAEALEAAVQLSQRYIPDQRLPDKAIGLLDLAGSRARRKKRPEVNRATVAEVVSDQTGVPLDKLLMRDRERFLLMEETLGASLIGHRQVVQRVSEVIRRNYAGFHSGRPIGSFLVLGPTGVGKTETVKVLADFLFRDRNAIVRLDMSEYRESHAVSRLIGAPPGYIGYDQGGQLTEAVRRKPYQIVLLDEVEKAHPEVLNVLLQLLDEGRLTDGRGRTINFCNTVVIMTSNLGSDYLSAGLKAVTRARIGFGAVDAPAPSAELRLSEEVTENVVGVARAALTPELWNRIEERLVFGPLSRAEVCQIARLQFKESSRRLAAERDIYMEAAEEVFNHLIDHGGYDPALGARPMRQTLQRLVETPISNMILSGAANPGDHVRVSVEADALAFAILDQ